MAEAVRSRRRLSSSSVVHVRQSQNHTVVYGPSSVQLWKLNQSLHIVFGDIHADICGQKQSSLEACRQAHSADSNVMDMVAFVNSLLRDGQIPHLLVVTESSPKEIQKCQPDRNEPLLQFAVQMTLAAAAALEQKKQIEHHHIDLRDMALDDRDSALREGVYDRYVLLMTWLNRNSWRPDVSQLFLQNVVNVFDRPGLNALLQEQDVRKTYLHCLADHRLRTAQQPWPPLQGLASVQLFDSVDKGFAKRRDDIMATAPPLDVPGLEQLKHITFATGAWQLVNVCRCVVKLNMPEQVAEQVARLVVLIWADLFTTNIKLFSPVQDIYALDLVLSQPRHSVTVSYIGKMHTENYKPTLKAMGGVLLVDENSPQGSSCVDVSAVLQYVIKSPTI